MSDVSTWSPTDEANTAAPPDGWPEFMQPSMVNNSARAMMGAVRRMYDEQINGAIVLPYLKLAGGQTVTGAVTFSAGLGASSVVVSGAVSTGGNVSVGGSISVAFSASANSYNLAGSALAAVSGGATALYDRSAFAVLQLGSDGNNYHLNTTHQFGNRANTVTYATIGASGLAVTGNATVSGDIIGEGNRVWCGPVGGQMALIRDPGANRNYLQLLNGWGLVLETNTGRLLTIGPPGAEMWVMTGFCYAGAGAVGGHGAYVDLSDIRLKQEDTIAPASVGLAEVLALNPVTFRRKPIERWLPDPREELGFIAQEVREALPHAVVEVELSDGPALGLTAEAIVAAMVNALKTIDQRLTVGGL